MSRKIIAVIDADEELLLANHPEDGIGTAFEKEMEGVRSCGIQVADWVISDSDDEVEYARYINYLFQWALEHANEIDAHTHSIMPSPMDFYEFQQECPA